MTVSSTSDNNPTLSVLMRRLLRRNVSRAQLVGFIASNLIGLTIVLTALQFWLDMRRAFTDSSDTLLGSEYIVLSKRIEAFDALSGTDPSFTNEERQLLASQPWVRETGDFEAADFDVFASVDLGGRRLSTSLFLETIPDNFFDTLPREWRWEGNLSEDNAGIVPVILPRDYLALYNFGYAASHGMPRLSESMMGLLPLRLSVSGNGRQLTLDARIVGFTSRLNTIAVPQQFMRDANALLGSGEQSMPSRLIVKVNDKDDPAIKDFLDQRHWERSGDNSSGGQMGFFLGIAAGVVIAVGILITVLSFFILLLSIYLLLQKNREKIHRLMLLGMPPGMICRSFARPVVQVSLVCLLLSMGITLLAQWWWSAQLASIGVNVSQPWITLVVALLLTFVLTLANITAIRRKVLGAFRQ